MAVSYCRRRNSFLLSMKEETIFNFKEESAKGGFAPRRPLWKPLLDFEVMLLGQCTSYKFSLMREVRGSAPLP